MKKELNPISWTITKPNKYNFEFSYKSFLSLIVCLYIPFAPYLYIHMIKQRTKALNKLQKYKRKIKDS